MKDLKSIYKQMLFWLFIQKLHSLDSPFRFDSSARKTDWKRVKTLPSK